MARRRGEVIIQALCPSPARRVVRLAREYGLKTGLDVGCGERSILSDLRGDGFISTGIDASADMLKESQKRCAHDEYILADFLQWQTDRKFDVVVLQEVIEHFAKEDGIAVLDRIESVAAKLIYVETPNGFLEQGALDNNQYQRHLSGWTVEEFRERGYEVYGVGIKGLRGQVGRAVFGMERTVRLIERLTRFLSYRMPGRAFELGAIKILDSNV